MVSKKENSTLTCIVAVIENGVPYFAGDAFAGNVPDSWYTSANQTIMRQPKVFRKGSVLFGFNGSVRMGQLVQHVFELPDYTPGQEKIQYLVAQFVPALQKCFGEAKFGEGDNLDGGLMLALEGNLFTMNKEFGVYHAADRYQAIGQGSIVAIGSLHTTAQLGLPPQERLYLALKAAERHTSVVSEPFTYITSEMDQAEILPTALAK